MLNNGAFNGRKGTSSSSSSAASIIRPKLEVADGWRRRTDAVWEADDPEGALEKGFEGCSLALSDGETLYCQQSGVRLN